MAAVFAAARKLKHTSLLSPTSFFSTVSKAFATISVGDKLPDATLSYLDFANKLQTVSISELTSNKKAIILAVAGAFTPTCFQKHLPEFAMKAADFKAKGVDTISCISMNDAFVMKAWKENFKIRCWVSSLVRVHHLFPDSSRFPSLLVKQLEQEFLLSFNTQQLSVLFLCLFSYRSAQESC
ncbi:Thioredoxin superfamily protein [Perilla frutescens var. hirtella]|uniref:glutaredoxin-dependent peroxiredoxin n=1 Tax=Perilla frutescens var. hirtella TaxID=608512 RepID=A0AAD4P3Y6_PERFH|nr:Thioredoxin superfamily protein [Perilla frutescens var. hirtella]